MADTNNLFQTFCSNITLSTSKSNSLKKSRDALRGDIKSWFNDNDLTQPKFCWQGSFSMKLLINPLNGNDYDLDDGIYLQGYSDTDKEDWPVPNTVHAWIKNAVEDRVKSDPIDKDTCIRVPYAAGYHIDLPIYIVKDDVAYLSHKSKGWIESDPKAFRNWFIEKLSDDNYGEQLRSIVKYIKSWKDNKSIPLKSIEATILATQNFDIYTGRDDKCLKNTIEKIINTLETDYKCIKPVAPKEDLFNDSSEAKKDSIISGLKTLKCNLDKAINESSAKTASEYLRKSFGDRFPLGEDNETNYASSSAPGVLRHDLRSA